VFKDPLLTYLLVGRRPAYRSSRDRLNCCLILLGFDWQSEHIGSIEESQEDKA